MFPTWQFSYYGAMYILIITYVIVSYEHILGPEKSHSLLSQMYIKHFVIWIIHFFGNSSHFRVPDKFIRF